MNLKLFNVATTNLFPATNTTTGGQLVTEYNLRSRESVEGFESIKYMHGPSFCHSETDFQLGVPAGAGEYFPDAVSGGTQFIISAGRAVIHGYYVENTVDMVVDMLDVNREAVAAGGTALSGKLCVGLRVMFSTEATMTGSILVEDSAGQYFEGIQVVILPESGFRTPLSTIEIGGVERSCGEPTYRQYVNADLLLGTFTFVNGSISDLKSNYPGKCQMLPASRLGGIDELISEKYLTKTGLNPKKLYTFAGKGVDPETGKDTWCDSTDALMVWDDNPQLTTTMPEEQEACFRVIDDHTVMLAVPHKQVDGMTDSNNVPQYYETQYLSVPNADWAKGTPGIVTKQYTDAVKSITQEINNLYYLAGGKQRGFVDALTDRKKLPPLAADWATGDYILVAKDSTVLNTLNDTMQLTPPTTIYVKLPGIVTHIHAAVTTEPEGTRLDVKEVVQGDTKLPCPDPQNPQDYKDWWTLSDYHGEIGEDYFELIVQTGTGSNPGYSHYYYTVNNVASSSVYSEPIQLTGQYPFATETLTGGFLNVPSTYVDGGYVYLDDYGHLRLMDYALLRSGTLAYQLGADYTVEAGLTLSEIQAVISEYVNERVAFPTLEQASTSNANMITVKITLPEDDPTEPGTLNISGIDSRFNTAVNIEIRGKATSATTVTVSDCEKVKITLVEGSPNIQLYRSCLYYDADLINKLYAIQGMSLWYEQLKESDPALTVEGMTVSVGESGNSLINSQANYNVVSSEYWTPTNSNDNHFMVALQSVTFDSNGFITGCGILMRNDSTSNVMEGKQVFTDDFVLPQGLSLYYPPVRLYLPVTVTGRFISAYTTQSPAGYMIQETDFTLQTQRIVPSSGNTVTTASGQIAILTNSYILEQADPVQPDVWGTNTFHYFEGRIQT